MHTSVFLNEAIEALDIKPNGQYIDATYGQGGHSREIIKKGGNVLAIDLDLNQTDHDPQNVFTLKQGNFKDIKRIAEELTMKSIDGVIFDFGLSMNQLKEGGKGLSFKNNVEPLDMRLSGEGLSAADILNTYSEEELTEMMMKYTEDQNYEKYARAIAKYRRDKEIRTVGDFLESLGDSIEFEREKRLARIFQALRIEVNKEYETITQGLEGARELVKVGGKIVTITFHSLEDRWVKRWARDHKREFDEKRIDVDKIRPVRAFERSATLRVMTKLK